MIRGWISPLTLLCVALLVFFNTLPNPFVHDDIVFILQNPHIDRLGDLASIFAGHHSAPAVGVNAYYRPFLELLYRAEYAIFGFHAWGWHLFNILIHGLNGILVWRLLRLLQFSEIVSWSTALLFIVHPIQTEAVACIAGVSNLMMALFVLGALIFYVKEQWFVSMLLLLGGLFTKEQTIMALPLFVLIDLYRGQRRLGMWVLFGFATINFLVLRQALTGTSIIADILSSTGELKLRLAAIAQVVATHLKVLFFPNDLHYYRSTDILKISQWWWLLMVAIGMMAFWVRGVVLFGVAWFIAALLPVLNIVPLINEYSLILSAEHFLYIPMIGIALIVVVTIEKMFKAHFKWIFGILIAVLAFIAAGQNMYWRSETALFERMVTFEPSFGRGHLLLAKAYYFDRRFNEADEHFMKAYEIMEGYASKAVGDKPKQFYGGFMKGILFDWAHSLENQGQLAEAQGKYLKATLIDPQDPVLWNNLGVLTMKMNDPALAQTYFDNARQLQGL